MTFVLLVISIAALSIGPVVVARLASRPGVKQALDGFVTMGIGGLVLFHVLPPSVAVGGYASLLFLVAGMILPTAIERLQHGSIRTAHRAALVLAFVALALHALVDGVALSQADSGSAQATSVAIAVVLHRIPEGLAVWIFLRSSGGLRAPLVVMLFIAASTVVGFANGPAIVALMQGASFGWFQAFLAGSLLHVVFHAHEHDHDHEHELGHAFPHAHDDAHGHSHEHGHGHGHGHAHSERSVAAFELAPGASRWARFVALTDVRAVIARAPEVLGALIGVASVLLVSWLEHRGLGGADAHSHAEPAGHAHASSHGHVHVDLFDGVALDRLLHLALDAAPWLLLGYLLSLLFFWRVQTPSPAWLHGSSTLGGALRGVVYGGALPVRACGVVPVFESLWDRGVRISGSVSFLLATPQLRIETLLFSIPLLGMPLLGVRVVGVAFLAVVCGLLASRFVPDLMAPSSAALVEKPPRLAAPAASREALFRLVDDTAPWVTFGLMVAVLVEPSRLAWFAGWPMGTELLFFAVLGVPVYLCATGATPVAAAMIFAGASPGGAIVFLLSGPMAKVETFRAIRARRGGRAALLVVATAWVLVLVVGAVTNLFFSEPTMAVLRLHDHPTGSLWQWLAFGGVGVLFGWSLLRRGPRAWLNTIVAGDHG